MKTSQASLLLKTCIAASLPALLVGEPGVGKTDIVEQAAMGADADLIISHPAVGDPTDVKGLPWPGKNKKEATFLPFGDLAKALNAKKPTVWFLDDLGQATPAVQAAYMQLLLARRVNEHVLPDCVTLLAATNGRSHRAGVSGILEPVKSRFVTIVNVEPDLDDWCMWAFNANVPVEVISFLRFRQELLNKFEPTADMANSPSPRTWTNVGKLMKAGLPAELEMEAFSGSVGKAAAGEFVGFLKMFRELPNLDAILLDPDQARIPEGPSALYATCVGLANKASASNFARVHRYAERLLDGSKGEFGVLLVKDALRKCADIQNTSAFQKMILSPLGKLFAA